MAGLFDDILDLEGEFFNEGYSQGLKDGIEAGRTEGRSLGMEKGFERFLQATRLHGKALVWTTRLKASAKREQKDRQHLPPLAKNQRLGRNVVAIRDLMEPDTLPTQNSDEAVEDMDNRVKRAQAKVRIVEKATGEVADPDMLDQGPGKSGNNEDTNNLGMAAESGKP